jgi:hypothetical protein
MLENWFWKKKQFDIKHYFPKFWKHANVIPVPKAGKDSSNPFSYHPISLLTSISKNSKELYYSACKIL